MTKGTDVYKSHTEACNLTTRVKYTIGGIIERLASKTKCEQHGQLLFEQGWDLGVKGYGWASINQGYRKDCLKKY